MKRTNLAILLGATMFLLFCSASVNAQSTSGGRSDQVVNQLLDEVRILRQEVRRLSLGTLRAQLYLEQMRARQDQVNRLNTELTRVRTQLMSIRAELSVVKAKLPGLQQRYDSGVIEVSELDAAKANLASLQERENELATRELQINSELNPERTELEDLRKKFDAIERELQTPPPFARP